MTEKAEVTFEVPFGLTVLTSRYPLKWNGVAIPHTIGRRDDEWNGLHGEAVRIKCVEKCGTKLKKPHVQT